MCPNGQKNPEVKTFEETAYFVIYVNIRKENNYTEENIPNIRTWITTHFFSIEREETSSESPPSGEGSEETSISVR